MRNEKGSGNALAFDLQVQENLRSYASINHIDEDELLGLYNIAVMYTVLGEISDHDLVYTKKDGKVDFSEDLFGKKAYITGSGQLHGETFASAFGKIYTLDQH